MREIEALYLDMIAAGRHYILIDNQYLTAHTIGEALAERLSEPGRIGDRRRPAAPESRLAQGDHDAAPPLKSHRPAGIEGLEEGTCIDVHSKVTIVDDEWLRVGSANVCNRSMGFDSECDLLLEARRRARNS